MRFDPAPLLPLTWLLGIPVAFGVMLARHADAVFVVAGSFFWPATALGWLGYWVAS